MEELIAQPEGSLLLDQRSITLRQTLKMVPGQRTYAVVIAGSIMFDVGSAVSSITAGA